MLHETPCGALRKAAVRRQCVRWSLHNKPWDDKGSDRVQCATTAEAAATGRR